MRSSDPDGTMPSVGAHQRADTVLLASELAAVSKMGTTELRGYWRRLYRVPPPRKVSRDLLELAVAWKLQERALGGLGGVTRRQLAELARTMAAKSDLAKARTVDLRPGARLVREWNGETHEVLVVDNGFQWRGRTWASLSVIARELTGTRWSGPRFFGLGKAKGVSAVDAEQGKGDR